MSIIEEVSRLSRALDTREAVVSGHETRYQGKTPLAFIPPETRKKLGDRLQSLSVNFCGLTVDMLAERLRLTGFRVDGEPDADLWERWQSLGLDHGAMVTHTNALALGSAYVSVWAGDGQPTALPEHPAQVLVQRHPLTGVAILAFKRWVLEGNAYAVLYGPHEIALLTSTASVPSDTVGGFAFIPPDGWTVTNVIPNPLGRVPVVPFVNAARLTEPHGTSEMASIADLNDALAKILVDMLVTSESSAKPRRWATGIQIETVIRPDGTEVAIDPWEGKTTTAQSESAESKFGQFSPSDLSAYKTAAELLVRQIGALSGLSPQMLGLHSDSAMSADAIRAAEASLTSKAEARQSQFGPAWAEVARLIVAIRDNRDPRTISVTPLWADPSTRSETQAADSATKLFGAGILSRSATLQRLGYTATDAAQIERDVAREAALTALMGAA